MKKTLKLLALAALLATGGCGRPIGLPVLGVPMDRSQSQDFYFYSDVDGTRNGDK